MDELLKNKKIIESKNRIILYLSIFVVFMVALIIFKVNVAYNIVQEIAKDAEIKQIGMQDNTCFMEILDSDGNGFTFPVGFGNRTLCKELEFNCNSQHHNVKCSWVQDKYYNNTFVCSCVSYNVFDV